MRLPIVIRTLLLATALAVAVASLSLAAPQAPTDAGGAAMLGHCTRCHALKPLCNRVGTANPRWDKTIRLMISYGMPPITDAEIAALAGYLDALPQGAPAVCGK